MTVFLTSSPFGPLDGAWEVNGVEPMNRFPEELKKRWKPQAKCLVISAFPSDGPANDGMRSSMEVSLRRGGLDIAGLDIWDDRTVDVSAEKLHSYDVVFLGGGHVPTENAFFQRIRLKETIAGFPGIVIGISAGTMNAAKWVYAQPELPGEAVDPGFQKILPGLALTKTNILPHYQMVRGYWLDGMRLYEDITFGDSWGREFLVFPDGSYLLIENGFETIFGEAYVIADGKIRQVCERDKTILWKK